MLSWLDYRNLDQVDTKIQRYKSFTVLSMYFNNSYCRVIVPGFKLMLSIMLIFYVVTSVKITSAEVDSPELVLLVRVLSPAAALYIFLILMACANAMSGLWEASRIFLWNVRHKPGQHGGGWSKKLIDSHARSCMLLRFAVGPFYYMEREAKLTLLNFLTTGVANLLIATK